MSTVTVSHAGRRRPLLCFARHLGEMTLAMIVGMIAYGAVVGGIGAAAGSTVDEIRVDQVELFALGMALAMSIPMVTWMRHRGHAWREGGEMTMAMLVPAVTLIASYRLGAVSADAVCPIACATMVPAMAVAMLFRLDAYTARQT
jgi:flagellar biosynthetic protein FliP